MDATAATPIVRTPHDATRAAGLRDVPGPSWPTWLQLWVWIRRPEWLLRYCERTYGPVFQLTLPMQPTFVFTSDPEAIATIFRGDPEIFYAGEGNRVLRPLVGLRSLLLLDGQEHRRERKLLTPPFHGERMRAYGDMMRQLANEAFDRWPRHEPFAVHPQMQALTLEIILRTVFGIEEAGRLDLLRTKLNQLLEFANNNLFLALIDDDGQIRGERTVRRIGAHVPALSFLQLRDEVDELLFAEFAARRRSGVADRSDILSLLLQATDEDGRPMDDRALRDEMITLLVAGHETTATAMSWATWRLHQFPAVRREARAEVERVGAGGPVPSGRTGELSYLNAFLKEVLRTTPVITAVARRLQRPMTVAGYDLPAGVTVAPNIFGAQHRPDLWPEPEAFRPERFLGKGPSPFEFLPFGGGVRTCLGMGFAYYEMRIVLSELLRRVRYHAVPGYEARIVRRNITFAPADGVPIVVDERR